MYKTHDKDNNRITEKKLLNISQIDKIINKIVIVK